MAEYRRVIGQGAKILLLGGNNTHKGRVHPLMPRACHLFTLGCMVWPMRESLAQRKNGLPDYGNRTVDSTQHRVYYEQRLYRNPLVGMLGLAESLPKQGIDTFVPLYQGVPIAQYRLGSTVSTTTISRPERLTWIKTHPFNSRNYKFDFRLQPEFISQFGFREQVGESKTNLLLQPAVPEPGIGIELGCVIPYRQSIG